MNVFKSFLLAILIGVLFLIARFLLNVNDYHNAAVEFWGASYDQNWESKLFYGPITDWVMPDGGVMVIPTLTDCEDLLPLIPVRASESGIEVLCGFDEPKPMGADILDKTIRDAIYQEYGIEQPVNELTLTNEIIDLNDLPTE